MAFQPPSARQELQNKKILEELHLKKQLLLKQGTVTALNTPAFQSMPPGPTYGSDSPHLLPTNQRAQLQLANAQSFGFFVTQDSSFGNFILPVLPRFETPQVTKKNEA